MRKINYIILIGLTAAAFGQSVLDLGKAAYNRRAEGSVEDKALAEPIEEAMGQFQNALNDPESEQEAALYMLKSTYFHGKFVAADKETQKADFQKGKDLGEKYIENFPQSAAIRYWYLVNLGSWSEVYGILRAAKEGVADLMKEHSEKIMELDPDYEDGGGYFMLGAVHYKSPYIPFILNWPDNDDAVKWLEKAVSAGKPTLNQKVYLAQALYKDKQRKRALRLLEEVVQMTPAEDDPVPDWEQIKKARVLLKDYR